MVTADELTTRAYIDDDDDDVIGMATDEVIILVQSHTHLLKLTSSD